MKIISVGSGSKGNCFFIQNQTETLMIDCGMGITAIRKVKTYHHIDTIDAILFTHNHSDHTKCKNYFKDVCTYAYDACIHPNVIVTPYHSFSIGSFIITPFELSHDAPNTVGYLIQSGDESLFYCTDTGYLPSKALELGKNCTYYIMESNHDIDMLMATNRPYVLKARILGDDGHLNNMDCAKALAQMIGDNTKHIYLAHISQQANDPLLAYQVNYDYLSDKGFDVPISALSQTEVMIGGCNE